MGSIAYHFKAMLEAESIQPKVRDFIADIVGTRDFGLLPLAGDASTRRYYRIVVGSKTWVLMSWEPFQDPDTYPFLNVLRHFRRNNVEVPEVLTYSPVLGQVILEDLGDLTLERKFWENHNQNLALPFYTAAVDELIKIHFHATDDFSSDDFAFKNAFDTEKLLWEMNYGREHLFEKFLKLPIHKSAGEQLEQVFLKICQRLDQERKFIVHRDYHSRNIMIKLGKTRIIDFQDARLGPVQYDLVSLIYDSYVNLEPKVRDYIVEDYLLKARGYLDKNLSVDQFNEVLRVQVIQRCFKACGSFASFYNNRGDRRYLKYIAATLKTVAEFLKEFKEYKPFLDVIIDNGLTEKVYNE